LEDAAGTGEPAARGAAGSCALAALGCASPNLYTGPRATPVGRFVGFVAPQLVERDEQSPMYAVAFRGRWSLVRQLDLGVRTTLTSAGLDLKWNAIRTRHFDLALDGGVQLLSNTIYVEMPVLLGMNVNESFSFLPSTGLTLGAGEEPVLDGHRTDRHRPAGRVFVRPGLGVQLRVTPRFAIQPEANYFHFTSSGNTRSFYSASMGFWHRSAGILSPRSPARRMHVFSVGGTAWLMQRRTLTSTVRRRRCRRSRPSGSTALGSPRFCSRFQPWRSRPARIFLTVMCRLRPRPPTTLRAS
jgi:hypothetical protein